MKLRGGGFWALPAADRRGVAPAAVEVHARQARAGPGRVAAKFLAKCSAKFRSFSAVSAPIFASKYAFCRILQNLPDYLAEFFKMWQICKIKFLQHLQNVAEFSRKLQMFQTDFMLNFWDCSGAKVCKSCRARKMLSNAYFNAKFRFDTAENEPAKNLKNKLKKHLPILNKFQVCQT